MRQLSQILICFMIFLIFSHKLAHISLSNYQSPCEYRLHRFKFILLYICFPCFAHVQALIFLLHAYSVYCHFLAKISKKIIISPI